MARAKDANLRGDAILAAVAHGFRPADGADAILKAEYFFVEHDNHEQELMTGAEYPSLGPGAVHGGTIKGVEEPSSYAAKCTVALERRTVPGEAKVVVEAQLRSILDVLVARVSGFKYELRGGRSRSPFTVSGKTYS